MDRTQSKIISLLKDFRKKVEKKIVVDKIILFGSRARNEGREDSDIDFIIVSDDFEGKKSFKRSPIFYYMWDAKYDVDIICLTSKELNKKKRQIGIISEAIKEGIEIK